jgi:hypothetical protein
MRLRGAATVMDWLLAHQGKGWQARWVAADADADLDWVDQLVAGDTRAACTARNEILTGWRVCCCAGWCCRATGF